MIKNEVGYTASLDACGWAGTVIEKVTKAFDLGRSNAQKPRKSKIGSNRRTDGQTDKAGCRVACTRLKIKIQQYMKQHGASTSGSSYLESTREKEDIFSDSQNYRSLNTTTNWLIQTRKSA